MPKSFREPLLKIGLAKTAWVGQCISHNIAIDNSRGSPVVSLHIGHSNMVAMYNQTHVVYHMCMVCTVYVWYKMHIWY